MHSAAQKQHAHHAEVFLNAPVKPIVVTPHRYNDEMRATVAKLTAAQPKNYIAMAARTLGRCAPGTFIRPEILCEAGLVMM